MSNSKMKVVIAGRTYPLTVSETEAKVVNEAADKINNMIQRFRENYAVKDVQDLLAMTALQLASKQQPATKKEVVVDNSSAEKEFIALLHEIEESLS